MNDMLPGETVLQWYRRRCKAERGAGQTRADWRRTKARQAPGMLERRAAVEWHNERLARRSR